LIISLILLIAGCTKVEQPIEDNKPEIPAKIELPETMPEKIEYFKRWMYGADYETEDSELISAIVNSVRKLTIGNRVDYVVDDFTDYIVLHYSTGEAVFLEFEENNIVIDGERYAVEGLGDLRNVLKAFDEEN